MSTLLLAVLICAMVGAFAVAPTSGKSKSSRSRMPRIIASVVLAVVVVVVGVGAFLTGDDPPPSDKDRFKPLNLVDDDKPLPTTAQMTQLAKQDPIQFIEGCMLRYKREVKGYSCVMQKQERMNGELRKKEVIQVHFREKPFSVFMDWQENPQKAKRIVYVEKQNEGYMLVKPSGFAGRFVKYVRRDPRGEDARDGGHFFVSEFGIQIGMQRTHKDMQRAKADKALHVEYLGEKKVPEADDRVCWVLKRSKYKAPEDPAKSVMEGTFFFDKKTWLQVGTILKDKDGKLVGEYYFRDIRLNPRFEKEQFTAKALSS